MDSRHIQRPEPIKLLVKGAEFTDEDYPKTYPLFEVSELVMASAAILRNSVSHVYAHGREIRPADIDIRASFPTNSSYGQELFVTVKQFLQDNAAPIVTAYILGETIKRANDIFAFFEHLRKLRKQEKTAEVEGVSDRDVLIRGDGDRRFVFNEEVLKNAPYVVEDYALVLERLHPERFSSLQLRAPDGTELNLNYKDTSPFSPEELKQIKSDIKRLQSEVRHGGAYYREVAAALASPMFDERKAVSLSGRIRALDLDAKSGRFHSVGNEIVQDGVYDFLLVGDQSAMDIRNLMGGDMLVVFCMPVRRGRKIQKLLIQYARRISAVSGKV